MTQSTDRVHPVPRRVLLGLVFFGVAGCAVKPPVDAPPDSVVFFSAFSANLDDDAKRVIDEISKDALANPGRMVIVKGYADAVGTTASNKTLSKLRAQVVADALVAKGVNPAKIVIRPRGATNTDPGIESRRVEVSFGH